MDSNHQPVVIWVRETKRRRKRERGEVGRNEIRKLKWSIEEKEEMEEELRRIKGEETIRKRTNEDWKEMKGKIERVFVEKKERGKRKRKRRRLDEGYREAKKKIREEMRKWRRQECPLSPGLFNMLIADLEERLRK